MSRTTLPPELPRCDSDDDPEVIVCRGHPRCPNTDAAPCTYCVRMSVSDGLSADALTEALKLVH